MHNVFTQLGGIWSSITEGIYDTWLDWSYWLVGVRAGEAGGIATSLLIVMTCSAILAGVMAYKRPRTHLEQSLFVREVILATLLAEFFITLFLGFTEFWVRIGTYAMLAVSSLMIAVFLIKEYTFDAWMRKDEEIDMDLRQYDIDQRQQQLDIRGSQQGDLDIRQDKLDKDRSEPLDNEE